MIALLLESDAEILLEDDADLLAEWAEEQPPGQPGHTYIEHARCTYRETARVTFKEGHQ